MKTIEEILIERFNTAVHEEYVSPQAAQPSPEVMPEGYQRWDGRAMTQEEYTANKRKRKIKL